MRNKQLQAIKNQIIKIKKNRIRIKDELSIKVDTYLERIGELENVKRFRRQPRDTERWKI